jgi:hypothetical protein
MGWTRKGRLGALGGAAGLVLVGALAVVALAGGDRGDRGGTKEPVGAGKEPVGTEEPGGRPGEPGEPPPEAEPDPEPDPLCVAHDELAAAVAPIGDVDGPDELEATILAQLAFHSAAAEVEPEPDAAAFRSVAGYYGALRDFYAARGWRPDAGRTDFGAMPRPPADGSLSRASDIVVARCDVDVPTDAPAG